MFVVLDLRGLRFAREILHKVCDIFHKIRQKIHEVCEIFHKVRQKIHKVRDIAHEGCDITHKVLAFERLKKTGELSLTRFLLS